MKEIQKIIQIGKNEKCKDNELHFLLPNLPILRGNEIIFRTELLIKNLTNENLPSIIKGLHLIERKYCKNFNCDFGFGSPSQTYNLLTSLAEINLDLAKEIELWISLNGGNYYIKPSDNSLSFDSKIQTLEMIQLERLKTALEIKNRRKFKKEEQLQISNSKIKIHKEKSIANRNKIEQLLKMETDQILDFIELDTSPIYFYKKIIEIRKEGIKNDANLKSRLLKIIEIKIKKENGETKKIRKIIE